MPLEYCAELMLARNTKRYLPLACDPRMKSVWWELSRQRANGGFLYPAIGIDQDAAMLELFNVALACREQRKTTTTQRQAKQQRGRYLTKADELMGDAFMMLVQSSQGKFQERFQKLVGAARAYEDYTSEIYAASSAMSHERKSKHDGRSRWVALTIGDKFRALFGLPMYGLTTTITSVVLDREIKLRTVRQWLLSGQKTVA